MHNLPTAKYPVAQRVQVLILDWADELALALGRSVDEIRSNGLHAGDFPTHGLLQVRLMDGSMLKFRHAFHVIRANEYALAIFTEHCGYHVFPLQDAQVSRVTESFLFPHSVQD